ncbi:iron complex transport system substrate-binding protein [Rosenbergiella nectarea]|uniref:Iron complex transport system substrate-binding protein n=1 Tax=Rosenbergiella nectarea TaxID=988801 RepID=A0A1H9JAF5_9GAMM|nr:ABC transporter substrate-binding protein [Rosenbergiella nectarea]SEQ83850.1 iron complex transport system substrate-binding protein [Rosenbergiella nectarea]
MRSVIVLLGLCVSIVCSAASPPTRHFLDDTQRDVVIPQQPLRIVSLHDLDITIPLLELGIMPVGSHGRISAQGKPYLRSAKRLTGFDFDNTAIQYLGTADINLEKIAALHPDLIITEPSRTTDLQQLQKIAPTVSLDNRQGGPVRLYQRLANLTHTQAKYQQLVSSYQAQIAELQRLRGGHKVTVSVLQANNGKVNILHTYHALGQVLRDAGLSFPPLIDQLPEAGRANLNAEQLPALDADIVFDTWRGDGDLTAQDERKAMNAVLPGWCQFMQACQRGHWVMVAREDAIVNSFASLSKMVAVVETSLSGMTLPSANH